MPIENSLNTRFQLKYYFFFLQGLNKFQKKLEHNGKKLNFLFLSFFLKEKRTLEKL